MYTEQVARPELQVLEGNAARLSTASDCVINAAQAKSTYLLFGEEEQILPERGLGEEHRHAPRHQRVEQRLARDTAYSSGSVQ